MLARLFRSNQPGILVLVLLLVPALFLRHLGATAPHMEGGMPLAAVLHGLFQNAPWTYGTLVLLTVAWLAVQLAVLMNETELVDRRNHLPALLFPVLLAMGAPPGAFGPALFGMPLALWGIRRAWSISNTGSALTPLFDAGLLLALAAMFFLPYVLLIVVVWASTSVVRSFQWRDYLVPVLGSALVFYLAWGMLKLMEIQGQPFLHTVSLQDGPLHPASASYRWMAILLLAPLTLIALLRFAEHYGRGVVREQNLRSAFIAFGIMLGLLCVFLRVLNSRYPGVLEAVPLAMLFTYTFIGTRRAWIGETALAIALVLALWMQYATPVA